MHVPQNATQVPAGSDAPDQVPKCSPILVVGLNKGRPMSVSRLQWCALRLMPDARAHFDGPAHYRKYSKLL